MIAPILAKDASDDHAAIAASLMEGSSMAYKYAKLANHTDVKNSNAAIAAGHLNRTLNSRKFKNNSNQSQKTIPAFEQANRTLENSPKNGLAA